jgi:hypothetical protein
MNVALCSTSVGVIAIMLRLIAFGPMCSIVVSTVE